MKKALLVSIAVCLFISSLASADTFGTGDNQFEIEFVTIGNPGNPGDTRSAAKPSGCGVVDYTYRIGKYEVINAQWNAFVLAAGKPIGNFSVAYDEDAQYTGLNFPANKVSWYEVAQFCNYLTTGDKSKGAYLFSGDNTNPGDYLGIDRDLSISMYGITYVIPTEDEWYKAAYYNGNDYSTYASGTDIPPVAGLESNYDTNTNDMDHGRLWEVAVGNGTPEQNGTFDMMGNVLEWTESSINGSPVLRGGAYYNDAFDLSSSVQQLYYPYYEFGGMGFRVASIPEPASAVLLIVGAGLLRYGKRKR